MLFFLDAWSAVGVAGYVGVDDRPEHLGSLAADTALVTFGENAAGLLRWFWSDVVFNHGFYALFTQSMIDAHATVPFIGFKHIQLCIIAAYIADYIFKGWYAIAILAAIFFWNLTLRKERRWEWHCRLSINVPPPLILSGVEHIVFRCAWP